jgi:hypothetical protein
MQTIAYGSGDEQNQSHGLCGVEHREVKAWTDGESNRKRGEESRSTLKRKIRQIMSDATVGAWRRNGGGQGVLSHPEGEGLRAYRARGRATPAEAIESSVVSLYQRTGIRKDETD